MTETIQKRIHRLKTEKNAIILAHNYELPEIQDIADVVGDSLELAIKAKEATEEIIVFCGVEFMAETAKILNPEKTVILPVKGAGCPLADQLTPEMLLEAKQEYPGAEVVVYVNSTAECKAVADLVCTSANAANAVRSCRSKTVIFGPDSNLADYVQGEVPEKIIIPVPKTGHCYVHAVFTEDDVREAKKNGRITICHPECPKDIRDSADIIASTGGMVREAVKGDRWTIFTEKEMAYRLKTLYPDKEFSVNENAICRDMKLTTLKKLEEALLSGEYNVTLPDDIIKKARGAIERMIAIRG